MKKRRWLSILLTLALILGMMSGMSLTALAYSDTPYNNFLVTTDDNKVKSGEALTALQVTFNGSKWYIIKDESTAADTGTVTLLAADTIFGIAAYDSSGLNYTYFSMATVKSYLDSIVAGTAGDGKPDFKSVAGSILDTANGKLYLLSLEEASALPTEVLKADFACSWTYESGSIVQQYNKCWWLLTPFSNTSSNVRFVDGEKGMLDDCKGRQVKGEFGIRPALQLDLSKVTFDSETNQFLTHTHDFTYNASGDTITATCTADGCTNPVTSATLTIVAPKLTTYGEGVEATASLENSSEFSSATEKSISDTDIKYVGRDGTTYAESAIAPTFAGKYTAKITVEGQTASVEYEIAKAVTTITTNPTGSEITYGQTLANSTLSSGTASVAGGFAWKDSTVAPTVSDSQNMEYDVVFTPTNANYAKAECKVKLTVNKANSTVNNAPTAKTLIYNGQAQELVTVGSTNDGTLYYAVTTDNVAPTDDSLYTTSIPAKTDAGTYHVWYRVSGDANHLDTESACVRATLATADLSGANVTLSKVSYVFDGKAKEPKAKVTLSGRTLRAGIDYSVSYKGNVKPGTATVIVNGKGNYKGTAKATFSLVPDRVRGLSTAGHPAKGTLDASWKAAAGARSYVLSWRAAGGKWKAKAVKGTSATIKGLEEGRRYQVRVRAKAGSARGEWSEPSGRWLRKVPSVKARAGKSKGSIKVSWDRDARANGGYVVQVCARKGGKIVAKKAVDADKTSATIKGLEYGKAYYVKVRPVRKASGTAYVGVQRYCETAVKAK